MAMTRDQLEQLTLRQLREMATKIDIFAPVSINGVALDHRDMIDYILKHQGKS